MIKAQNNIFKSDKKLKIINFYSENCPPCHAFMPNFYEAEKILGDFFNFVIINSSDNPELFQKYKVMGTPTIIILDGEKIVFNQSGVPNGGELKKFMMNLAGITEEDLQKMKQNKKKKWFFGLF